jgi:hypothetical protein
MCRWCTWNRSRNCRQRHLTLQRAVTRSYITLRSLTGHVRSGSLFLKWRWNPAYKFTIKRHETRCTCFPSKSRHVRFLQIYHYCYHRHSIHECQLFSWYVKTTVICPKRTRFKGRLIINYYFPWSKRSCQVEITMVKLKKLHVTNVSSEITTCWYSWVLCVWFWAEHWFWFWHVSLEPVKQVN